MALACRCCRVALSAQKGCAICDPVRPHLVSDDEDDGDRPALAAVSAEVVGALRNALRATTTVLHRKPSDVESTRMLLAIGNTLAKVLESGRKLQQDGLAAVQAMAFRERAELFCGWYADLPPGYRQTIRGELAKFEVEAARPMKELPSGGS